MTSKDIVRQTLEKWGFPILQESENALVIRYQLNYVQIGSLMPDSKSIAVTLTGAITVHNDREKLIAIKTCNELNYRMMQVKLYIDEDNDLVIASEFFYNDGSDVEYLLDMALHAVVVAKKRFTPQYDAEFEEDKLIRELEGESDND